VEDWRQVGSGLGDGGPAAVERGVGGFETGPGMEDLRRVLDYTG
jgi:hypothetical protein